MNLLIWTRDENWSELSKLWPTSGETNLLYITLKDPFHTSALLPLLYSLPRSEAPPPPCAFGSLFTRPSASLPNFPLFRAVREKWISLFTDRNQWSNQIRPRQCQERFRRHACCLSQAFMQELPRDSHETKRVIVCNISRGSFLSFCIAFSFSTFRFSILYKHFFVVELNNKKRMFLDERTVVNWIWHVHYKI